MGLKWPSLFALYSVNQQQEPDWSSVIDEIPLAGVGTVHSVNVAWYCLEVTATCKYPNGIGPTNKMMISPERQTSLAVLLRSERPRVSIEAVGCRNLMGGRVFDMELTA